MTLSLRQFQKKWFISSHCFLLPWEKPNEMCFSGAVTTVAAVSLIKSLMTTCSRMRLPVCLSSQLIKCHPQGQENMWPNRRWVNWSSIKETSLWVKLLFFPHLLTNPSINLTLTVKHNCETNTPTRRSASGRGLDSFANCRTVWIHNWIDTTFKLRKAWPLVKADEQMRQSESNGVKSTSPPSFVTRETPPGARLRKRPNCFALAFLSLPPLDERDVSTE